MWALGVLAYETIMRQHTFARGKDQQPAFDCAAGRQQYPWEADAAAAAESEWLRSRLRPLLQPLLSRDPEQRPSAEGLLGSLDSFGSFGPGGGSDSDSPAPAADGGATI